MPALPPYIIEVIWEQFVALLPRSNAEHPWGCHRPRVPDRLVFEKLVPRFWCSAVPVGAADEACSATVLRLRPDEWIEAGAMDALEEIARDSYDRIVGLDLSEIAVDCCITKAPCGGEKSGKSRVDRAKRGLKRSVAVDGGGIPLGYLTAPANRHDCPLLPGTLKRVKALGLLLEGARVHLERGYDSGPTRERLRELGLVGVVSEKGKSASLASTKRWVVERTNSWHNAHKKLLWCTERRERVIDFWVSFSNVVIIVRRFPAFHVAGTSNAPTSRCAPVSPKPRPSCLPTHRSHQTAPCCRCPRLRLWWSGVGEQLA